MLESLPPIAPLFELVRVFKPELLPVFFINIAFVCAAEGVELLLTFDPFSLGRLTLGAEPGREELPAAECIGLKATLCCWSPEMGVPDWLPLTNL